MSKATHRAGPQRRQIKLTRWAIVETDRGSRDFIGYCDDYGETRVSSTIVSFDAKGLRSVINPPPFHVTQADLEVRFARTREARAAIRNFKISYPNWCALDHHGRDLVIRNMLARSGIEPMA